MLYDKATNVVAYEAINRDLVSQACPDYKDVGPYVAVKATLPNLQALTMRGLVVPEPMAGYDWPGPFDPFHAQRVTANFLALNPRSFCLSDMGTGKTMAALWAADYVMSQYPKGQCRALIVSPLSTLRRVWSDAIFQTMLGRRKCVVLHGDAKKRDKLLAEDVDFYIINHDGVGVGASVNRQVQLTGMAKQLAEREDIKMVIVDECSAYRDPSTRRHRIARALIQPRPYLWMMTGTPTPNGPLDAYGQAKLINNSYGETLTSYKMRVMQQISQFKWIPKPGAYENAKKLLSPAVRFAIEDCVDLPECTVQRRDAELSPDQSKAMAEMKKFLRLQIKGNNITAVNEGVLRWKLLQIACGAIYGEEREIHTLDAAPRLSVLREVVEQCKDKIIIFAPLTSVVTMLHKELSKDYSCAVVNGQVPYKDRSEIFRKFQSEEHPRIIVADPGTMSHGLTLTAATAIVWFAPTDKTEVYLQANKRIHRPGQVKTTTVVQIAGSAIEREIYRRLESNESMQGVVLKLAEEGKE
jgi:SNF2 family DNA or RNA helicase